MRISRVASISFHLMVLVCFLPLAAPTFASQAQSIKVKVVKKTYLRKESTSNSKPICEVNAVDAHAYHFENGFYKISLLIPCGNQIKEGFIEKSALLFPGNYPQLLEVKPGPTISVQMNYSTDRIFCQLQTGCLIRQSLYGQNRCFLLPATEKLLQKASTRLGQLKKGYKLKLLDCYRPMSVQKTMFDLVKDERWVALPPGGHNRGIAVDLTLEDSSGKAVDMGSGFDEFSDKSNYDFPHIAEPAKANRKLLNKIMTESGFASYRDEWWHFLLPNGNKHPALDYPI